MTDNTTDKIYVLTDFLLGEELSGEGYNMVFEENFDADDLRSFIQYAKDNEGVATFDDWFASMRYGKAGGAPSPKKKEDGK